MRPALLMVIVLGLLTAACAVSSGDGATSTSLATTTTAAPATTTTSTTIVEVDPDCSTAYFGVARVILDPTDPSACVRVGTHFRIAFENGFGEPIEVTWDGEPVTIDDSFEPPGVIGDYLDVGVHRIQSPRLPITIEVVDPATSRYVAESMFLRTWGGLGPGRSLADLEASGISVFIPPDEDGDVGTPFCTYGFVEGDPYSPGIMILNGAEIGRLDATAPQHQTASGVRFGATTERVLSLYEDQIEQSPHGDGEYLTFLPEDAADRSFALVFETDDDGVVGGFRTGLAGPVRWPEGCLG